MRVFSNQRVLFTHPGKIGDLLWSLCTVRSYWEQNDRPEITFATSEYCRGLLPILEAQPYISHAVVLTDWVITGDCPGLQPAVPPVDPGRFQNFAQVHHLGLTGWPEPTLVEDYGRRLGVGVVLRDRPWIRNTVPNNPGDSVLVAFTDEWFELKVGLWRLINKALGIRTRRRTGEVLGGLSWFHNMSPTGSRWDLELGEGTTGNLMSLMGAISRAPLVITDKSAARVMAYGMGVATVVVEPSGPRHNPVFDPPSHWRQDRAKIEGFDAREVVQAVKEALKC